MSRRRSFSGYRPRLLTLLVVLVIAAIIALSNLSYDTEGAAALASLDSLEDLAMADDLSDPDDSHSSLVKLPSVLAQ